MDSKHTPTAARIYLLVALCEAARERPDGPMGDVLCDELVLAIRKAIDASWTSSAVSNSYERKHNPRTLLGKSGGLQVDCLREDARVVRYLLSQNQPGDVLSAEAVATLFPGLPEQPGGLPLWAALTYFGATLRDMRPGGIDRLLTETDDD